jgi:hypothetical protein
LNFGFQIRVPEWSVLRTYSFKPPLQRHAYFILISTLCPILLVSSFNSRYGLLKSIDDAYAWRNAVMFVLFPKTLVDGVNPGYPNTDIINIYIV